MALIGPLARSAAAEQRPVTAVVAENRSASDRPAGPVTFGMIFAKGDVPQSVAARGHKAQAEVKRRWPDGSVKHAVLTVDLPAVARDASCKLELVPSPSSLGSAPADPAAELRQLKDVQLEFRIHGGPRRSVSLSRAIRSGRPKRVWLAGDLVREVHFLAVPTDEKGQADPDLEVRFRVRHYPSVGSARVAVIVENSKWTSPGGVPYDVTVRVAGTQAYAKKNVGEWPKQKDNLGHCKWARWIKRFWIGRPLDDVHVRYDVPYLAGTALLPRYDASVRVPERALTETASRWQKAATDILQRGTIAAYFPMTGGRGDIGPLPRWTARYLLSQDPRARRATWGNADLSGSCPVHVRDPKSDWFIDIDEHPGFSFNERGTRERIAPRDTAATPWIIERGPVSKKQSHFSVDSAHQPSLAYVPYLFSCDYYYLEEMGFWASRNMVVRHYAYRQRDKGIVTGQTRAIAWAVRNILHAAALAPDGTKEKRYFEGKLENNLRYLSSLPTGPEASPLGIFKYGKTGAYTRGWPGKWRGRYWSLPPWQHNFLAWMAAHAVDHGYETAIPFRDYMMKFTIGLMTHPDEVTPFAGTSYFVFIGRRSQQKNKPDEFAQTWRQIGELTYGSPTPPGVQIKRPTGISGPNYACNYGYIARGVVIEAVRAGRPGARDALKWINAQFPNRKQTLARDPTWAFEEPK